ncbi:VCBS repeat-containing protein [Neolewinella litorea]|uniref:ASPIC/UnbV domain-containing protein n=1 Tax=Neolewinella litorea TaxID=2562452 RepID=A0A4S4NT47_9BACT|nr:VCBS repeat-containing protein [Neolewinella litorea]THH41628.1 hypothetical protein E4021_03270 [Neolewinella litorea]
MRTLTFILCCCGLVLGCSSERTDALDVPADKLFSWMTAPGAATTGVEFSNDLDYTDQLNPYTYRNFYNGGGVGIGDFNNDGLADLYFTGNLVQNRLYLNRGDWQFEDVTAAAGVGAPDSWSTGVAVADINADGWQDIYVCKAGPPAGEAIPGMTGVRHNELFINNGDGTFTESATAYGLDVVGLSVHSAFFDYDGDGDLDCYLLNNSTRATTGYDLKEGLRDIPDQEGGNRLYRNQLVESGENRFTDVTQEAGIYSSNIGFGLGVTVGDINLDGFSDLFISNDYFERDYLYVNQGNGTFVETLPGHLAEISKGSMGADLADINNDGLPDLFVTEMLPADDRRYKTKAAFDGWNRYQLYRDKGYHQQFSRNVLQLNRGNGYFSEVGRLSGVEATDWSWGALLADFDNDGWRDIFVANGTGKDLLDQDYINFNGNPAAVRRMIHEEGKGMTDLIDLIPSEPLPNAIFRNRGDLTFEETAQAWGLDQPGFSNGSAYADLDNDGDLDLVINNVDAVAGLYRNNSKRAGKMLHLRSSIPGNPDGIGARLILHRSDSLAGYAELHPMRGFQSTVDKRIHAPGPLDSVTVYWSDGQAESFSRFDTGSVAAVVQGEGRTISDQAQIARPVKTEAPMVPQWQLTDATAGGAAIVHREDPAVDFDRDPLLFIGLNNEGPALAVSDLESDGRRYVYLGGAAGEAGRLLRGLADGTFEAVAPEIFAERSAAENVAAAFFDADGDGDQDLYVANGSNQFGPASANLLDDLYFNLGGGRWRRNEQLLPLGSQFVASGCVAAHDVDGDGDTDLFVGGRLRPGTYGVPATSYLLLNEGDGQFRPADLSALDHLGMITDAVWANVDDDPELELVVVGEWSPIRYLHFSPDGEYRELQVVAGTSGLWHAVVATDLDGDGREDVVAGNHGLNSRLTATAERPLELYVNDFDGNGKPEQILTHYGPEGIPLPLVLRDDLVKQLPGLRKQLQRYADYPGKTLHDLFGASLLERSIINRAEELRSVVVLNRGSAPDVHPLPTEVQFAPVYAIAAADINGDDVPDLLLAGNQSVGRPEVGIYAAGFGAMLLGRGDGTFITVEPQSAALYLAGDVRAIAVLPGRETAPPAFLIARSNGPLSKLQTITK